MLIAVTQCAAPMPAASSSALPTSTTPQRCPRLQRCAEPADPGDCPAAAVAGGLSGPEVQPEFPDPARARSRAPRIRSWSPRARLQRVVQADNTRIRPSPTRSARRFLRRQAQGAVRGCLERARSTSRCPRFYASPVLALVAFLTLGPADGNPAGRVMLPESRPITRGLNWRRIQKSMSSSRDALSTRPISSSRRSGTSSLTERLAALEAEQRPDGGLSLFNFRRARPSRNTRSTGQSMGRRKS